MIKTVSIAQAAHAIGVMGMTNTVILRGQPGIGKSSVLKQLGKLYPNHHLAYIDCATMDLGDLAMPVVDKVKMVTNYAPNARFMLEQDSDRPIIFMLDELGKAAGPIINMLLPTVQERRLGDRHFPAGSLGFVTTNLDTDNIGDRIPAHAYNRMDELVVRMPTGEEWVYGWAAENGVDEAVLVTALEEAAFFQSYTDIPADATNRNPYIFDPRLGNVRQFVSPRSLERASNIVKQRARLDEQGMFMPMLAGCIGWPAAELMEARVHMKDQLPAYADIVSAPSTTKLPKGAGPQFMLAFQLAHRVKREELNPVIEYTARLEQESMEAAHLVINQISAQEKKMAWAQMNSKFAQIAIRYGKMSA